MDLLYFISLPLLPIIIVLVFFLQKTKKEVKNLLHESIEADSTIKKTKKEFDSAKEKILILEESITGLEKYQGIVDVEKEIDEQRQKIVEEQNQAFNAINAKTKAIKEQEIAAGEVAMKKIQDAAHQAAAIITRAKKETETQLEEQLEAQLEEQLSIKKEISEQLKEAKARREETSWQLKGAQARREEILKASYEEVEQIINQAKERAESIAGEAVHLAGKENQLSSAIQAMKNTIKGYGEQYIIPPFSLLDELADQYDFKEAGIKLKEIRSRIKMMVKNGHAATCEYVEINRKKTAIRFVLDAFNGKVDTVLSKVKHDNYGKLKQQIEDAYAIVNINGAAFRDARIKADYLTARLEELHWATAAHELRLQDREEQRRLKEEMREEAKAKKEFEKAIKEAEKEEKLLQKAMAEARRELDSASDAQKAEFEAQLRDLQDKLQIAEEKNQRALSMAQQTRKGHVYIISNEGSFGESVVKIGLTRRLDPMDRVKELGDASVPFPFDIHAIMYSDDSPALERELHRKFNERRVNKINLRKEFFKTTVAEVRKVTDEAGIETKWTMAAEAREYRESASIERAHREMAIA